MRRGPRPEISIDYDLILCLYSCFVWSFYLFFERGDYQHHGARDRVEQLINQGALNFSNKTKLRLSVQQTRTKERRSIMFDPYGEKAQR